MSIFDDPFKDFMDDSGRDFVGDDYRYNPRRKYDLAEEELARDRAERLRLLKESIRRNKKE